MLLGFCETHPTRLAKTPPILATNEHEPRLAFLLKKQTKIGFTKKLEYKNEKSSSPKD